MIQEFIHDALRASGHLSQMGDASIQIPYLTSLLEDFKDAVAEDQQARASRDGARLRWENGTRKHTHDQTSGTQKQWIWLVMDQ